MAEEYRKLTPILLRAYPDRREEIQHLDAALQRGDWAWQHRDQAAQPVAVNFATKAQEKPQS